MVIGFPLGLQYHRFALHLQDAIRPSASDSGAKLIDAEAGLADVPRCV